jgi:hypothetical protein
MKNWKTSCSGLAMILGAATDMLHCYSAGLPINFQFDISAIFGGIGLIFAKDASTSSTQAQVDAATLKADK